MVLSGARFFVFRVLKLLAEVSRRYPLRYPIARAKTDLSLRSFRGFRSRKLSGPVPLCPSRSPLPLRPPAAGNSKNRADLQFRGRASRKLSTATELLFYRSARDLLAPNILRAIGLYQDPLNSCDRGVTV